MSRGKVILLALLLLASGAAAGAAESETTLPAAESSPVIDPAFVVGPPEGPEISGEELDRRTHALAAIMRCPVCQALSVADSPTSSALAMKEEARDLLARGYSEDQVLEYFEKSYGEFILLAPKKKGLNWLVWIAPVVVLLGGAALILARTGKKPELAEAGSADADTKDQDLEVWAERVRREVGE